MLNAIKAVKYHALCYTWSDALCSFLFMDEGLRSLLYMD